MSCCSSDKVIKSDTRRFLALGGLHEDKVYDTSQTMAPTNNVETVHQTSLLHIKSNLDRLGLLSPTHDQGSQQHGVQATLQLVLIKKSKFLKAHVMKKNGNCNSEVHGGGGLEMVKPRASQRPAVVHPLSSNNCASDVS